MAKYLEVAREVAVKTPKKPRASTPGRPIDAEEELAAKRNGAYADSVRAALKSIGRRTDTIPTKSGTGYCSDFLVRKMYLGCIASASDGTPQSWENMSLMRLREFCADAREHMSSLPETWTATEASMYVCVRPDWAIFISMYMCLWKEVSDAAEKADTVQETIRWIAKNSEELVSTSVAFKAQHGFSPHPWILMREAGWHLRARPEVSGKRRRKGGRERAAGCDAFASTQGRANENGSRQFSLETQPDGQRQGEHCRAFASTQGRVADAKLFSINSLYPLQTGPKSKK